MKASLRLTILFAALLGAASQTYAGTVYIPLGSAGEVMIVDATSDLPVGNIKGVDDVHGLTIVGDGKFLVAGSYSEVEPGMSALPLKPAGISESEHQAHHKKPDKPAASERTAKSFVSVIRTADRKVVMRIPVPGAVHHAAATPNARYVVVTHPNNDGVSVIDLSTNSVLKTIRTGSLPNYVVVSSGGNRAYVSNADDGTVTEIDTIGWTVMRQIRAGENPEHIALSRDDKTLYVSNVEVGMVSEIALAEGRVTRTFKIGGTLHGIDLSEDGKTIFVSATENNKLVAVDLASGQLRSIPLGPSPYHLTAVTGTGKLYISSADEPKVWVVDQKTLRIQRDIQIQGKGHQMVVLNR